MKKSCHFNSYGFSYLFFQKQKSMTNELLNKKIGSVKRFSQNLDEWTSLSNKRYINIKIHLDDSVFFNLGLVKIIGSCDAVEIQRIVN